MRELSNTEIEKINGAGIFTDVIWDVIHLAVDVPSRLAGVVVGDKVGGTIGLLLQYQ
ncbi:hypothetical protein [Limnobaculum parvum]|uniref:hypothetical protein n=1 Tax=Limnobaculum parvum TaxID=2172103 RepID=UPI0018650DBB|nr:hypothetical protein [Limnobaculum parvum]